MRKLLSIIAAVTFSLTALAQQIAIDAPKLVQVGEQFTVSFTIEGESRVSDFAWEVPNDFNHIWGPQQGSSTSISIINGKKSTKITKTFTYILEANRAGKFTLPAASASIKDETVYSQTFSIEAVAEKQSAPSQGSSSSAQAPSQGAGQASSGATSSSTSSGSNEDLFMKMYLNRTEVVVGEPVTVTLKLYNRNQNLTNFDDAKFPVFDGFWSQDISPDGNIEFERENVDGRLYSSAIIKKWVIIPQKAGNITIDGSKLVCRIDVRRSTSTGSVFDGFFDDYETIHKTVTTPSRTLKVKSLPAGAPDSFYGGVGKFSVSAKVAKKEISAHEASSLVVSVAGTGNVALLETPKVKFPPDFEVYDVKTQENIDKGSGNISGTKTYEYPFIPRSAGDFTIPEIEYTYFDTETKQYVTVKTSAIDISVAKAEGTPASVTQPSGPSVSKKGVKNLGEDIRFIYTRTDALSVNDGFFVFSALFWIVLVCMFAGTGAIWAAMKKLAARRSDVKGMKQRKATKMALSRLKKANEYLEKSLSSAFYEELHKALMGFASDRLGISASELNKERIKDELERKGVEKQSIEEFIGLVDACEQARYCPNTTDIDSAMKTHYDTALVSISDIDSQIRKGKGSAKSGVAAVIMVLFTLLGATQAQAGDRIADSLFVDACAKYTEGNYQEALDGFTTLYSSGFTGREMEYNMGNAFYKNGNWGKAILHYERALKIDPAYDDARYNLEAAKAFTLDDIESVPEFFLKKWLVSISYSLSSNGWATLFFILLALSLASLLIFLLGNSSAARKTGFFCAIFLFLFSIGCLLFSADQKREIENADYAIVLRAVSVVKSSPSDDSSMDLFILHEGTKVEVLDNIGTWSSIKLADGRKGWLKSGDMEVI